MIMKTVQIYTDGACSGNPGPGGWRTILRYKENEKVISGAEAMTTNNRMELTAILSGLEALNQRCFVELYTDSKYAAEPIRTGKIFAWADNNWRLKSNKEVKNADIWKHIADLMLFHHVTVTWIKGHDGHPENERCDKLATSKIQELIKQEQ